MNDSSRLFVELQPPDGGLRRLQRTLEDQSGKAHQSGWRFAAGAIAMSLLALAWLLPGTIARHRQTASLVSAMRSAMAPPANGIHVINGAAIELPSGQPGVRLYLVQSTTSATDAKRN